MNKLIYQIHGWLGLNFGLVLFIICLSGSFAVVSHEIDWLCNPAIRVSPEGERLPWSALLNSAEQYASGSKIRMCFTPHNDFFAAEFWTRDKRGNTRRIYVNPYNGKVTGEATWMNAQRFFRDFHRRFYIMAWWGIWVVAIFSLPLLLSSITGLLFYKRWWKQLFVLRLRAGRRAFLSDLHRQAGIWTLLFTFVIGITGIWYFVEIPLNWLPRKPDSSSVSTPAESIDRTKAPLSIDKLLEKTEATIPGFKLRKISFPTDPAQPIRISGQATAWLVRDRTNWVQLDSHTGDLVASVRAEDLDILQRWSHTADPLHFGNFGGLTSKLIWFVSGILLSALIPTGAYLWIRRHNILVEKKFKRSIATNLQMTRNECAKEARRNYWVGLVSTLAIVYFASVGTFDALSKQYYSLADEGNIFGLGEPAVIVTFVSFIVGILVVSLLWFYFVWRPRGKLFSKRRQSHSTR